MTPKAVLFDCDGVLVDSEPLGLALLQDDLARHGFAITMDEIHAGWVGMTISGVADKARKLGAALPPDWTDRHYALLYHRLAEGIPLIPGVEDLLDRLDAAGISYAVGSNGTRRKMEITLSQHPRVWPRLKDHLHSGQELARPKPDPALCLNAAADLGVAPGDCVVVEDSAPGCRAGVAAGMRTLGLARHDDGARLAAEGAEVFHSMDDLPARLGF